MDHNTLTALLGDAYDDTTPEQRDAILGASEVIDARWPDPDLEDARREALNAAMQVILGDARLYEVARAWHDARAAERSAMAALTGALVATREIDPTESEVSLSARTGVARMTVRKALGK